MTSAILHLRRPSLARGNLLVFGSVLLTFKLSDFPHNRATLLLLLPAAIVLLGTIDTARCIRPRWSLYHGGVLLCLYMDLMAITLVLFSLLYPYLLVIRAVH
ncbi:MAG: permease [Acidobacteriota bacterium]|nr:permease [Acidobacteriota bacterium]